MGACGGLRERAVVLVLVIILVVAAVAVYAIWAVKPKRIKFRAGVLKIVTVDFEADAGSPVESGVAPPVDEPKRLGPLRQARSPQYGRRDGRGVPR